MNYQELTIEDFEIGDIWRKKDGHKMEVSNKTSSSVEFRRFVHKSSENYKSGMSTKMSFKQWWGIDVLAGKRTELQGFNKEKK